MITIDCFSLPDRPEVISYEIDIPTTKTLHFFYYPVLAQLPQDYVIEKYYDIILQDRYHYRYHYQEFIITTKSATPSKSFVLHYLSSIVRVIQYVNKKDYIESINLPILVEQRRKIALSPFIKRDFKLDTIEHIQAIFHRYPSKKFEEISSEDFIDKEWLINNIEDFSFHRVPTIHTFNQFKACDIFTVKRFLSSVLASQTPKLMLQAKLHHIVTDNHEVIPICELENEIEIGNCSPYHYKDSTKLFICNYFLSNTLEENTILLKTSEYYSKQFLEKTSYFSYLAYPYYLGETLKIAELAPSE